MRVNRETALKIIESFYIGEPCRFCKEPIIKLEDSVWAGYSEDNTSRLAHPECWKKNNE